MASERRADSAEHERETDDESGRNDDFPGTIL
jgi:hypothetical protein